MIHHKSSQTSAGTFWEEMIRDQSQEPKGPRSPSVTDRRQNRWDQLVHVPAATVDVDVDACFDCVSCLLKLEGTPKCQTQPDFSLTKTTLFPGLYRLERLRGHLKAERKLIQHRNFLFGY